MNSGEFLSNEQLLIPENMIMMYAKGAFPMADETGEINWYMPEQRTIIPLDKFNIPRSLKKHIQNAEFEYQYDKSTLKVVEFCAKRESTWISDKLLKAYKGLQKLGHLHSVEVYNKSELVGGLYGVTYRGAFFGESMFSIVPQASKCALVKLIDRLTEKNFILLDVQYQSEHLKMFGSVEISFDQFAQLLFKAHTKDVSFS